MAMAEGSADRTCLLCDGKARWWFPVGCGDVVAACNDHAGAIGTAARYERRMKDREAC